MDAHYLSDPDLAAFAEDARHAMHEAQFGPGNYDVEEEEETEIYLQTLVRAGDFLEAVWPCAHKNPAYARSLYLGALVRAREKIQTDVQATYGLPTDVIAWREFCLKYFLHRAIGLAVQSPNSFGLYEQVERYHDEISDTLINFREALTNARSNGEAYDAASDEILKEIRNIELLAEAFATVEDFIYSEWLSELPGVVPVEKMDVAYICKRLRKELASWGF